MRLRTQPGLLHVGLSAVLTVCAAAGVSGCGLSLAAPTATTEVTPLATDDLVASCSYDLMLQEPKAAVKGLLVIFERGDSKELYNDLLVRQTVGALGFGIIFAHECDARSSGDLQSDASKGPARALIMAIDQFAVARNHPEFKTAGMVLYGFSAAGVLTATMANTIPMRMIGAIEYAPGSKYTDLDDVAVSSAAARIPTLILANARDEDAGTTRNYNYFLRGRATGMLPWGYAVQNATDHCCNLSTRNLILPWIQAIAAQQTSVASTNVDPQPFAPSKATGEPPVGALGQFTCTPDGVVDAQGQIDCGFTSASLGISGGSSEQTVWLPDTTTATAWLTWATNPVTN